MRQPCVSTIFLYLQPKDIKISTIFAQTSTIREELFVVFETFLALFASFGGVFRSFELLFTSYEQEKLYICTFSTVQASYQQSR